MNTRAGPAPATIRLSFTRAGLAAGTCGEVYGLGLARYIFESAPLRFTWLQSWPGSAALALLCAGLALLLVSLRRTRPPTGAGAALIPPAAWLALLLPLISVLAPDVNLLRAQTLLIGAPLLMLVLAIAERGAAPEDQGQLPLIHRAAPPALLFALLLVLYLPTVVPTVGEADPFEFQVGVARLGVAHGSGYPLLILIGKLFSLLPVGGTLAFRANLEAAFFAALAAIGVERLARRLGAAPVSALLAGFAFGVSPGLWARATEIESYSLNAAFTVLALHLCVHLVDRPASRVAPRASAHYLLAFALGLGLTNHLTLLMLAPACLAAVLLAYAPACRGQSSAAPSSASSPPASHLAFAAIFHFTRRWPAIIRRLSPAILLFLLGYALNLYIPLRWPAVSNGEWLSLERFILILRGGEAAGYLNPYLPLQDFTRYGSAWQKITGQYTWVGFLLAVAGALTLAFQRSGRRGGAPGWRAALVLALAYAGYAYFALAFNTREPDWSDFFIPLHLIAALMLGLGLDAILTFARRIKLRTDYTGLIASAVLTAFLVIPLRSIWTSRPGTEHSRAWERYRWGAYTLAQPLAQGATILADPARLAPLVYQQVAEGVRPDLDIVILPDEASYRAVLEERLAAGRTVYLARFLPGLGAAYSLRSVGPLAEVSPRPFTAPAAISRRIDAELASGIRLLGYEAESTSVAPPGPLRFTLYWRADAPADDHYLVNLQLRNRADEVVWQSAGSVPVAGLYPTNAWRQGEVVSDFYEVPMGASLAPGDYRLEVGLFPPFRATADTGWAQTAPITLLPAADQPQPSRPMRARFGDQWLLGYDGAESAAPGSRMDVTLYWLRSETNEIVTTFGQARSLGAWPMGAVAPLGYRLTVPASQGSWTVEVDTGEEARCGWLRRPSRACRLPPIEVLGAAVAEGAINFDNQFLLRRATIHTPEVEPGEVVEVTLEWQALRTITEDYTVFVHLVGPDGRLYGQVDYWPVFGTLGTSRWTPGQVIMDPYRVPLAADAPAGEYAVHVGMYLLATLERLPVLNSEGVPVDDKVVVGEVRLR